MSLTRRPLELASTNGAVPIRCFTGESLMPEPRAEEQLRQVAAVHGVAHYVAVLPDVHYKSRNPTPTGTVVVSRDVILPRAIDEGTNCGMRIVATPVDADDLEPAVLDELFGRLMQAIPLKEHAAPLLTDAELEAVLADGAQQLCAPLGLDPAEPDRFENRGRMLPEIDSEEIRAAIPPRAIRKGRSSLGTVGAGNHFLELQTIVEVLDEPAARRLGLEQGKACFMLHSDSRRLGKKLLQPAREQAERLFRRDGATGELWTLPTESDVGRRYLCGLAAASHAGFANRAAVTQILRRTFCDVLADGSLSLPLVYDCGHETIQRERHGDEHVWVHRHGASRALPAGDGLGDPVLRELGQPVPIPGNMGSDSYIAVAGPGAAHTFHSVAHGAGRTMEKARAAEVFDADDVQNDVRARGVRLYRYGSDNIAGQAPASFKDAARVVEAMAAFDLIRPVARLHPIAVLKG